MAWYPGAVKKEIRPGVNDPLIIPLGIILHTDAGNSSSLFNYFNGPSGGIESHFHIPKSKPVEQYRDTGYEADANLKANSFYIGGMRYGFISIETQGLAGDPWTDYQLAEIKKLILWARSVHQRIELRVCPGPFSAGIGYHTLFGSPSPWTPVAKSCPGPVRIKQFNNVIVPWLKTAADPKPVPTEDDMSDADVQKINSYTEAVSIQIQKHIDQVLPVELAKALAADNDLQQQIADVYTPESGDTAAATTLLTWTAPRAATLVVQQLQPVLDAILARLAAIEASNAPKA
jgi:hypothetical protein